jgi:hypothetical protein
MGTRSMSNREATVIGIIRLSAVVRAAAGVFEMFERAARESSSHRIWSALSDPWRRPERSRRLRSIGIALVTAVAVHAALLALRPLPGWRALVVPAIALAQGLLLILVSPGPRSSR